MSHLLTIITGQRYGSKVHALGAGAPPRAHSSPHEGRIIPKRSRGSHGWRTWGQPFAMHRRELTALSTAARTRVHISLLLVARREFCAPSIASRSSTCVRAPRERDRHASRQDGKTARAPWETASVPGTTVNGTIHAPWGFCSSHQRPADGRTARHAARLAGSGSSTAHALSSQVLSHNMHNGTRSPTSHRG